LPLVIESYPETHYVSGGWSNTWVAATKRPVDILIGSQDRKTGKILARWICDKHVENVAIHFSMSPRCFPSKKSFWPAWSA